MLSLGPSVAVFRPFLKGIAKELGNHGRPTLALQNINESARLQDREYDKRNVVVARQGNRPDIHDLEPLLYDLVVGKLVVSLGGLVLLGVGRVDAVHLRSLEQRIAAHFGSAKRRAGI